MYLHHHQRASLLRGLAVKLVISDNRSSGRHLKDFDNGYCKKIPVESFTPEEIRCIADSSFLLTKVEVIRKMDQLFAETRDHLRNISLEYTKSWPPEIDFHTGKISRGENYRSLPYLVLDYPSYFSRDDIFSLRTMFWWANFFSCTLHLQGIFLEPWRPLVRNHIDLLASRDVFISVGPTPWEYHYGQDNYAIIDCTHQNLIDTAIFLKLSIKIPLGEIDAVKEKAGDFWRLMLSLS